MVFLFGVIPYSRVCSSEEKTFVFEIIYLNIFGKGIVIFQFSSLFVFIFLLLCNFRNGCLQRHVSGPIPDCAVCSRARVEIDAKPFVPTKRVRDDQLVNLALSLSLTTLDAQKFRCTMHFCPPYNILGLKSEFYSQSSIQNAECYPSLVDLHPNWLSLCHCILHVLSLASSITRNASVPFHPCYCVPSARDHGTCQHNYDCRHECCIACNTELDDSSNRNLISSFQPRCEWFFFICFFCLLPYLY